MSRIFDALKEATRFRESAGAGEGVWKALINGVEVTPGLDRVQAADAGSSPPRAGFVAEGGGVAVAEELLSPAAAPANRPLGILTKVGLDKNARLIRHGVDPV